MKKITFSIRDARSDELSSLIKIYRAAFSQHNIFQRKEKEILKYLQQTQHKNKIAGGGYLVALVGNKIVGALLVRQEAEDISGKHTRWKYNHLAVAVPFQRKGIGSALLQAADKKVLAAMKVRKINTAKVEIGVAENEQGAAAFYINNGFKVEGKLHSHYRFNEMVYVMGKELKI